MPALRNQRQEIFSQNLTKGFRTSSIGGCLTRQPLGLQTLSVFTECLLVCRVLAQGPFGLDLSLEVPGHSLFG